MAARTKTRLPLQLGTTFVFEVIVAATLVAAMPIVPFLFIVLFGKSGGTIADELGSGAWVPTLLCPAILLLVGYASLRRAPKRRPSDLLVDARGLVVQGGAHHGLEIEWTAVEPEHFQVVGEGRVKRLVVSGGGELAIAETTSKSEQRAFELTVRTLREVTRSARRFEGAASPARPDVLACQACGNAVAPDDADHVRCDCCSAAVAVPADLRERVRRAAEVQRAKSAASRRVVTLLDQPSASAITRAILLLALPALAAWVFAAWVTYRLERVNALRAESAIGLFCFVAVTGIGCYLAGRALADRRETFGLVTHQLSALAPPRPGAHHLCRACGAPLWEPPHEAIVVCAYCQTENVLGFDVRRDRRANDTLAPDGRPGEGFSLRDAFDRMARQRVLSFALIAAAGIAAFVAIRLGRAVLDGSLEAAGYVEDPSRLPPPKSPVYEEEVRYDWAPPPAGKSETLRIPRVEMRSDLGERLELYARVWECRARELASGARGSGTVRVARWRKVGDSEQADVRTDVSVDGALGPSLSACIEGRTWKTKEVGVALFTLSERSIERARPPSTSIAKSAFVDSIDATLLSLENVEVVASDETRPTAMWRSYVVRAKAKFLTAGFENRCALRTTYARSAEQGCVSVEHAAGDALDVKQSFYFQLGDRGWCGGDALPRCYCGDDAPCGFATK